MVVWLMAGGYEDLALHDGVNADCGVETWRRAQAPRLLVVSR